MRPLFPKKAVIACVLAMVALPTGVEACDLCAQYPARPAWGERGDGFILGLSEQFTSFETVQLDGEEVPNTPHQFLDSSITQVLLGYHFRDRFAVQLSLPVIYRSFQRIEDASLQTGNESGIGDLSIVGDYRVFRKNTADSMVSWDLVGGVKFPTGSTRRLEEETQEQETPPGEPVSVVHGHDLTLGSGSYDGIVGTSLYGRWKKIFATAAVQYAIRSRGDYGYRFADDLTWWGGPGVFLLDSETRTLALQLNVSGETKGKDDLNGATAEDTGVTTVFLGPQVTLTWGERLSAEIGLGIPVVRENTALQIVPDYRIRASVSWLF